MFCPKEAGEPQGAAGEKTAYFLDRGEALEYHKQQIGGGA